MTEVLLEAKAKLTWTKPILDIFEKAYARSENPLVPDLKRRCYQYLTEILYRLEVGHITQDIAFLAILGCARAFLCPLTPMELREIGKILGTFIEIGKTW